ncbi:N-acetylmuramic acid 6-phosphate etherase [Paracoccaceae bacterium GXU_MW_L88]
MTTPQTEALHEEAVGLDARPLGEVAELLLEGQVAAAQSVRGGMGSIVNGARAMAEAIRSGGTLYYIAAGSSGLMAAADAQELGGTFSIPHAQIQIHMAGGLPTGPEMPGGTEDETAALDVLLQDLRPQDTIITVSASGTTPYTVAAARIAKAQGAAVIAISNNRGAPLFDHADHAICAESPPEVLSGSTRMGAGTAQKIALNMLSTLMAVDLGHVHDGMMVNLRADNQKLRARALATVSRIADVEEDIAARALDAAGGEVKAAILIATGVASPEVARAKLEQANGRLRAALAR